jgi:Flagellar hook-length control protein FliK
MTPIAAPQIAPVASSAPPAPVQLELGQILSGTVLALLNDTTLRLQTPAGLLDIATNTPLPAGTHVAITVQGTPQQPELVITPVQNGSSQPTAQQTGSSSEPGSPPIAVNSTETASTTALVNSTAASIAEPADQTNAAARTAPPLTQAALSAAAVILRNASATQGSLTTLYSNLKTAVTAPASSTPAPVLEATKQLLAMRFDIASGNSIDANDVKLALMRSGLVSSSPVTGASPQNASTADLGAALIVLRQALKNWLDQETDQKTAAAPQSPVTAAAPRGNVPMPPYRGSPSAPQAPLAPSLSMAASPREQAIALLGQTDAAIARQTLLRIASLPSDQPSDAAHGNDNSPRLMFEIPIATVQGTGVAPMMIEHDGGSHGPDEIKPQWRASFSIDLESIGPVHVRIALTGERASVTLKAERARSAELLSAELPLLGAGLRQAEIEPGDLRCHVGDLAGSPHPQAAPGTFLDQAS